MNHQMNITECATSISTIIWKMTALQWLNPMLKILACHKVIVQLRRKDGYLREDDVNVEDIDYA